MKWMVGVLVAMAALVSLGSASAQTGTLSRAQFRDAVVARIVEISPGVQFEMRDDLGFDATLATGLTLQVNLEHGYAEYRASPDQVSTIVDRWARFTASPQQTRDATRIVIVLRPNSVIDSYNRYLAQSAKGGAVVTRPFLGDLQQVLVFDSAESVEYATTESLAEAGLTLDDAWPRALANLPTRIGKPQRHETNLAGIAFLTGGNGLTPSLLLDPTFCTQPPYVDAFILVSDRDTVFLGGSTGTRAAEFWGFSQYLITRGEALSQIPLQCRGGRLEVARAQ